jgi:hypothetical protein
MRIFARRGGHRRPVPPGLTVASTGFGNALRRVTDQLGDSLLRLLERDFGAGMNSLPVLGLCLSILGFLGMPFVTAALIPVMAAIMAAALFGLAATDQAPIALVLAGLAMMTAVAADRATATVIKERRRLGTPGNPARAVELATTWWAAPVLLAFGAAVYQFDWRPALRGLAVAALIFSVLAWRFVPRPKRLPLKDAAVAFRAAFRDLDLQRFQLLNAGTKSALRCVLATLPLLLQASHGNHVMIVVAAGTETVGLIVSAALQGPWKRLVIQAKRERVQRYWPDLLVVLGAALILGALGAVPAVVMALCVTGALLAHIARTTNNIATQMHVGKASEPAMVVGRQAIHGIWRVLANGVFAVVIWLVAPTQASGPVEAVLWLAGLGIALTVVTMVGRMLGARRDTES